MARDRQTAVAVSAGWAGLLAAGGAAFGLGWLGTEVSVPLWGVLVLMFVPAETLVSLITTLVESAERRAAPEDPPDA